MKPKDKALLICQQFGSTTKFAEDCNDGKTLPLRVVKMCAMILVNELIERTKEPSFPMGGIDGRQYDYDNFWLEVKEEIEKL